MATETHGVEIVRSFLDNHSVRYALSEHDEAYTAASEARASGAEPSEAAKTVMLRDEAGYLLAVIPAPERLDLAKVRRLTGRPSLSLASEADLERDFPGFQVGALPPLGPLFGAPELVDSRLLEHGKLLCNGGDHRHSVVLDVHDLVRLAGAEVGDLVAARSGPEGAARSNPGTPRTMRALQLVAWQQPPEVREVPVPEPGPGQVLIKVGGAGACHSDLHLMDWPPGQMPFDPPFTLGHENAGWVARVGAGVDAVREGEPVAVYGPWGCGRCSACRRSSENYCERQSEIGVMGGGLGLDGGMAEYLLVPSARLLVPLGELDPADAAPLGDAALTPYHAIKRSLHKLVPGSTAVVIGVGGLGHMAIQILSALSSARIVAVDTSPEKLALATGVGAEITVEAGEGAAEAIREATRGRGAELVLDLVGSEDTIALAAQCGRFEGDLTIVGLAGGAFAFSFFSQPYECSLQTTYWGSAIELIEVLELARAGKIHAHVERHPFEDAIEVYERLRRGEIQGRAVVCPSA